jgi:hypothetical protein
VANAIIFCDIYDEVLHSLDALEDVEVMDCHATHVLGAKYDATGYISVNTHFVQRDTNDWTLDGFALRYEKMISSKSVSNACDIITVVCISGAIALYSALFYHAQKTRSFLCVMILHLMKIFPHNWLFEYGVS